MNFYQEGQFRVIENPELGIVIDFGVRKILAQRSFFNNHVQAGQQDVIAFSCEQAGDNIVFYKQANAEPVDIGICVLTPGVANTYSDTFKLLSSVKGTFVKTKLGSLNYYSNEMFVPYKLSTAEEVESLGKAVANVLSDLTSLHKNRVEATIGRLAHFEALGINENVYNLAKLHLLLYRPTENLYANFKKSLMELDYVRRTDDSGSGIPVGEVAETLSV